MLWPIAPQFWGLRAAAAGLNPNEKGNYAAEWFQQDFPQFFTVGTEDTPAQSLVPSAMLEQLIDQANAALSPGRWGPDWRRAAGLYVAHYAALYLRTYAPGSHTPGQAAASGALQGTITSAKLGNDSVGYSADALTKATADWGDLNATQYGQQLAARARLIGLGGGYVI